MSQSSSEMHSDRTITSKTALENELHGVMASWTDIEKIVDIFCLEFFPEKSHNLYCAVCSARLLGKTSKSVFSHQSDSKRCKSKQDYAKLSKKVSKGFFYWSDGVEVDNSILDLRGDIVSVFRSYVSTDTEIKYSKQRLQCLQWLVCIFRGHLPRERVQVEDENPDDEAKLSALFGVNYKKRKRRMALQSEKRRKV